MRQINTADKFSAKIIFEGLNLLREEYLRVYKEFCLLISMQVWHSIDENGAKLELTVHHDGGVGIPSCFDPHNKNLLWASVEHGKCSYSDSGTGRVHRQNAMRSFDIISLVN